jgi:hypothetical protein
MAILTVDDFKRYCLRSLGAPVINIDVTDEQLQDRYEDALRKYRDHHFDATEKVYFKHQITQENFDNKMIPIPDNIVAINKVIRQRSSSTGTAQFFDVQYQFLLNQMHTLWSSGSIAYYAHTMQHLTMMDQLLNGESTFRFNKTMNKLFIDVSWDKNLTPDRWVVIECYVALDPETYPKIFEDVWLKRYTTALIKRQWGENLSKFAGVQMVGGVTLNGPLIYEDAVQQIQMLEQELRDTWEAPMECIFMA